MTLFVVTLFLPYTAAFDVSLTPPDTDTDVDTDTDRAEQVEPRPQSRAEATAISLFTPKSGIPPLVQTPGATTDHERIFIIPEQDEFVLKLPMRGKDDPRAIAQTDLHSPTWGQQFNWRQPSSRAKSPPSSSVAKYESKRERTASFLWSAASKYKSQARTRSISHERNFSLSNFTVEQANRGNGGLVNAIRAAEDAGLLEEKIWVGTLGMPTDALDKHLKSSIREKLEHDYDSLAVYVEDSDLDGHYVHYCKTILWPIFHYQIPDNPKSKAFEDHSWIYYVKVNQAFADSIAKNWKRGDVVWVHDYHLLLVPGMLRTALGPDAQIGFFLHVAFPSSEIFRCLAVRKELLEGLLGANMIGFQTDEYCHHFLQTCSRLLTVEATKHGVVLEDGRFVHVDTFPIGIDPKSLDTRRELAEVDNWIKIISEKYQHKRIIVARDKLDGIRGVRQKMLAYELFLNKYPKFRDQVVLIQIATSTTEQAELETTVSDIVTRVNSQHSTLAHQPLVFLKQDIPFSQYLALLTVAEVLMITSLREGMNLTSHEFVYCQDGKHSAKKYGPLILSEFTGSASILQAHQLSVNPWDYKECAEAIKTALDMDPQERKCRWHGMYGEVMHHTAVHWFSSYMQGLETAWKEQSVRRTNAVPRLNFAALRAKYETAQNGRLFMLDYEGTLASWGSPSDIILTTPKRAIDVLNDLQENPKNTIYVMSALMPEQMERLFRRVPGIGMIAENGCFIMEPGSEEWCELEDPEYDPDWKDGVRSILKYYNERIEGSRIEERHCSFIFDYSPAQDAAGAKAAAGECANHINEACQKQHVHAVPSDHKLVVCNANLNKASATTLVGDGLQKLHDQEGKPLPDFLMVIGDSREDEIVFNWAHKLEKKGYRDVVTVTLDNRATEASATLTQGVTGVLSTLQKLAALH